MSQFTSAVACHDCLTVRLPLRLSYDLVGRAMTAPSARLRMNDVELSELEAFPDSVQYRDNWHNQRLEFLGDAVLKYVSGLYAFCGFWHGAEGKLTDESGKLKSNKYLRANARFYHLHAGLFARPLAVTNTTLAELRYQPVSQKMQADIVEALIGAVYISNYTPRDAVATFATDDLLLRAAASAPRVPRRAADAWHKGAAECTDTVWGVGDSSSSDAGGLDNKYYNAKDTTTTTTTAGGGGGGAMGGKSDSPGTAVHLTGLVRGADEVEVELRNATATAHFLSPALMGEMQMIDTHQSWAPHADEAARHPAYACSHAHSRFYTAAANTTAGDSRDWQSSVAAPLPRGGTAVRRGGLPELGGCLGGEWFSYRARRVIGSSTGAAAVALFLDCYCNADNRPGIYPVFKLAFDAGADSMQQRNRIVHRKAKDKCVGYANDDDSGRGTTATSGSAAPGGGKQRRKFGVSTMEIDALQRKCDQDVNLLLAKDTCRPTQSNINQEFQSLKDVQNMLHSYFTHNDTADYELPVPIQNALGICSNQQLVSAFILNPLKNETGGIVNGTDNESLPVGALGAKFSPRFDLLRLVTIARTHPSARQLSMHGWEYLESFERFEFLGDSVLGSLLTEWLYAAFVDEREGNLSLAKSIMQSNEYLGMKLARRLSARGIRLSQILIRDSAATHVPVADQYLVLPPSESNNATGTGGIDAGTVPVQTQSIRRIIDLDRFQENLVQFGPELDFEIIFCCLKKRITLKNSFFASSVNENDDKMFSDEVRRAVKVLFEDGMEKLPKSIADVYEAMIAALHIDCGFDLRATWCLLACDYEVSEFNMSPLFRSGHFILNIVDEDHKDEHQQLTTTSTTIATKAD